MNATIQHGDEPLAAGSRLAGAELELVEAPVRVRCQTCGAETDAALNRLVCGECGDWHTQLVSGDELLLESVELEYVPAEESHRRIRSARATEPGPF